MRFYNIHDVWQKLTWPWRPESNREAGSGIVANFLLHWFPNRVSLRSLAFSASLYLGTITFIVFLVLTVTGVVLMFLYVPSVERAYWSIKDLDHAVSFGWLLRRLHRITAHLMVALVFLHMFRVFLTGSYKAGEIAKSARPFNWVIGVSLLVLTLLLSFTGYLLPWDQLAFWAITVGTNIAAAVPLVGETIRQFLLGGTMIGQPTLIRFYVLHCALLPLVLFAVAAWHMWRIRKDGGLAIVEQDRKEALAREPAAPRKSKTYSVLGIASGTTVQVNDPTTLNEDNSVPSTPFLTVRLLLVILLTVAVSIGLSLVVQAPLEAAANPEVTPNPAKAPWYFLGLQERPDADSVPGPRAEGDRVLVHRRSRPKMGYLRLPLRAHHHSWVSGNRDPRPHARHLSDHREPALLRSRQPRDLPPSALRGHVLRGLEEDLINPVCVDRHFLRLHHRVRPPHLHGNGPSRAELGLLLAMAGVADSSDGAVR